MCAGGGSVCAARIGSRTLSMPGVLVHREHRQGRLLGLFVLVPQVDTVCASLVRSSWVKIVSRVPSRSTAQPPKLGCVLSLLSVGRSSFPWTISLPLRPGDEVGANCQSHAPGYPALHQRHCWNMGGSVWPERAPRVGQEEWCMAIGAAERYCARCLRGAGHIIR